MQSQQAPPQPNATSPQQQFCLRWNNYQTNLTNVFDQLLQSESFVDVTLACDGHSVKAHKMVLSACSPYFQSLFFENPCQHPIVIMRDIKWPELKAAVEFMYKGEINVCQEQIGPLLKVAESLKIRGLADVNGEQDVVGPTPSQQHADLAQNNNNTKCASNALGANSLSRAWDDDCMSPSPLPHSVRPKKRRRNSHERSGSVSSPADSIMTDTNDRGTPADLSPIPPPPPTPVLHAGGTSGSSVPSVGPSTPVSGDMKGGGGGMVVGNMPGGNMPGGHVTPVSISSGPSLPGGCSEQGAVALSAAAAAAMSAAMNLNNLGPPPPPPPSQLSHLSHSVDDLEIKPGIAEMIREEERAKLLESSHAWLGASTSSIADSYQYQLQSMWQKCWSTNQSLVHNLRFRERGPLKSWRPETMAEAIFSVLKEGLSLSQAARKYDIPYPTFVLYANRVHNMLGPSADGGADLRPKGRGRPQRILLGVWPDEHIRGVIRAVVFRDTPHHIKEEAHLAAAYPRIHDSISVQSYSTIPTSIPGAVPGSCGGANGPDPSVSPGMAAAVAAVAQGLRQQMCSMVAAAQHGAPPPHPHEVSGLAGLGFNPNHRGGIISPTSGGIISPGGIVRSFSPGAVRNFSPNGRNFSSYFSSPTGRNFSPGSGGNFSPSTSPQDLRGGNVGPVSPTQSHLDTPLSSPLALDLNTLAGSVEVGLSTGIAYKPPRIFAPSPRPENLFHDEIEELVKTSAGPLQLTSPRISALSDGPKDVPIKLEPMTECRSE